MVVLTKWTRLAMILAIIALSVGSAHLSTTPPVDGEAMGKAAVLGFAANVQSFPYYQCRYKHTTAQAKSVEDAIRGKFTNAISYDNRLIVDGDKDLCESLAPPVRQNMKLAQPFSGRNGMFRVPALTSSDRYLADGKSVMNYCPQLGSLGLWSKAKGTRAIAHTPLGMHFVGHRGEHGPDRMMGQNSKWQMSCDGMQEIDGRPVVTVRFKDRTILRLPEGPLETSLVYSFEVGCGNVPLRMTLLWNNKTKSQAVVTHVRECTNQRWFPERSVDITTPDKGGDLFDVSEIKLLELDADRRPAAEEFAFTIPAGTSVSDQNGGRGSFTLKQDEKIGIAGLPTLFTMLERAQVTPLMDTAVARASPYRWMWAAAGLTLACAGVFFVLVRRWRARAINA